VSDKLWHALDESECKQSKTSNGDDCEETVGNDFITHGAPINYPPIGLVWTSHRWPEAYQASISGRLRAVKKTASSEPHRRSSFIGSRTRNMTPQSTSDPPWHSRTGETILAHFNQPRSAVFAVKEADECPHDRTPLFDHKYRSPCRTYSRAHPAYAPSSNSLNRGEQM